MVPLVPSLVVVVSCCFVCVGECVSDPDALVCFCCRSLRLSPTLGLRGCWGKEKNGELIGKTFGLDFLSSSSATYSRAGGVLGQEEERGDTEGYSDIPGPALWNKKL